MNILHLDSSTTRDIQSTILALNIGNGQFPYTNTIRLPALSTAAVHPSSTTLAAPCRIYAALDLDPSPLVGTCLPAALHTSCATPILGFTFLSPNLPTVFLVQHSFETGATCCLARLRRRRQPHFKGNRTTTRAHTESNTHPCLPALWSSDSHYPIARLDIESVNSCRHGNRQNFTASLKCWYTAPGRRLEISG